MRLGCLENLLAIFASEPKSLINALSVVVLFTHFANMELLHLEQSNRSIGSQVIRDLIMGKCG